MSAILTSTGITFSDSTSLNSKYGVIAQNSVTLFYQAAAPTGWTKVTTLNDRALRVVSGNTGGSFGGSQTFSTIFPSTVRSVSIDFSSTVPVTGTVGNHTLTVSQIPDHTHNSLIGPAASASSGSGTFRTSGTNSTGGVNSPLGIGQAHNHPFSGQVDFTTTGTGTINLALQYIDVILCTFS